MLVGSTFKLIFFSELVKLLQCHLNTLYPPLHAAQFSKDDCIWFTHMQINYTTTCQQTNATLVIILDVNYIRKSFLQ